MSNYISEMIAKRIEEEKAKQDQQRKIDEKMAIVEEDNIDNEDHNYQLACYAFYDNKSNQYDTPFYCKMDLHARRHYQMVANDQKSIIHSFPEDFDLVRLGYFNSNTGKFKPVFDPIIIGKKKAETEE